MDAAGRVIGELVEPTLDDIAQRGPGWRRARRALEVYGALDPSPADLICRSNAICAGVIEAARPEVADPSSYSERDDTRRAQRDRWSIEQLIDDFDSPYAVTPIAPFAHLRTRTRRSAASLPAYRDELENRADGLIDRDRRALIPITEAPRLNEELLNRVNQELANPALDPQRRAQLIEGGEFLRWNSLEFRRDGVIATPDTSVAPGLQWQPRQAPPVLAPSEPPRQGDRSGNDCPAHWSACAAR